MTPNPADVVTPPVLVPPEALAAVSPTGAAVLPQTIIKVAVPLVALAGALAMLPETLAAAGWVGTLPAWALVAIGLSKVVFALGAALGIASQGARKSAK